MVETTTKRTGYYFVMLNIEIKINLKITDHEAIYNM